MTFDTAAGRIVIAVAEGAPTGPQSSLITAVPAAIPLAPDAGRAVVLTARGMLVLDFPTTDGGLTVVRYTGAAAGGATIVKTGDMSYENILVETHGKVGLIRLNRPGAERLSSPLMAELGAALAAFEADPAMAAWC